jgi:hypothetical protein
VSLTTVIRLNFTSAIFLSELIKNWQQYLLEGENPLINVTKYLLTLNTGMTFCFGPLRLETA